ncbi:uncharacterized protein LOC100902826 [Galendromus occidentalis]|uniref:Uncharacterized protein LOC100902826 n=1 Tax=Galendromus occidentalis TaxID=34638 RepID=A0AAJ7SCZ6_9ACAR|nr:uncharacterized protein LOC100902826 [Galendromus occidentalis]
METDTAHGESSEITAEQQEGKEEFSAAVNRGDGDGENEAEGQEDEEAEDEDGQEQDDGATQTLYVQQMDDTDEAIDTENTHIIHIIQDESYQDVDGDDIFLEEDEADEDEELTEVQVVDGKIVHYLPVSNASKPLPALDQTRVSKKHGCGEEGCESAFRNKKNLVSHLSFNHDIKLATFFKHYTSVTLMLYEFERIQRHANYLFGADYKTYNSCTKQLRVIYVCAHDRMLRKNRNQTGQVCTAYIEFHIDYSSGVGTLSGCLQHYKHTGYRDLCEYQFTAAPPADYVLTCPICGDQFTVETELLQHAAEKLHHIAPRFIRLSKKKELGNSSGWDNEVITTQIRCDLCSFETRDRSYYMTHRVKAHLGSEYIDKYIAKDRDEANYIFRQAQQALNTRFFLANKRVNDSSIISYSFRCNFNRRSLTSVCVCSFKMLEFPGGDRFEIDIVKLHNHDVAEACEEEIDDLPPPPELFSCETCEKVFQNDAILREHMKTNKHYSQAELDAKKSEQARSKQFFCPVCAIGFTKKISLRQHQKNFNHDYVPVRIRPPCGSSSTRALEDSDKEALSESRLNVQQKKVIQLFPNLCYDCNQTLPNKVELLRHLGQEHGYEVDLFSKEFVNMDHAWKFFYEIQIHNKTRYKQHGSQKVDEDNFKIYYICNREGKDKTKKVNRQRSRRKPPKDVNRACTAHFTIRKDQKKIICTGSTTHYGHEIEEEFLIRGKILQKAMEIIHKVADEAPDESQVLTASDFPYHSEKKVLLKANKPSEIPWTPPFSDTFTVTPIDATSYYVGPTNKQARVVSHKTSTDDYCSICTSKPTMMKDGQCPHIYQCDCDFYLAGYHNCKHINVLELYLHQEATQDNVLYLTAPCSEEDLDCRRKACKVAQLGEDLVKILENLNASEESTKLLTAKMNAMMKLLQTTEVVPAEPGTETPPNPEVDEVSTLENIPEPEEQNPSPKAIMVNAEPVKMAAPARRTIVLKAPVSTTTRQITRKSLATLAPAEQDSPTESLRAETISEEKDAPEVDAAEKDEAHAPDSKRKLPSDDELQDKRISRRPKRPNRRFEY